MPDTTEVPAPADCASALSQLRPRPPYAILRFPAVQGSVLLVGYDGRGEVMVEMRVRAAVYSDRMVEQMRRWVREHDASVMVE